MVKQIGTQNVSAIKGQSYAVEPASLGVVDADGYHETKASIMARLGDGQAKSLSKMETMKKYGLGKGNIVGGTLVGGAYHHPSHHQNRALEDGEAMRKRRLVVPFRGGVHSPFLNFSSGRSTKGANKERMGDPAHGRAMVGVDTAFNRY